MTDDDFREMRDGWGEREWAARFPGALGYEHAARHGYPTTTVCAHENWYQLTAGVAECTHCGRQEFRTSRHCQCPCINGHGCTGGALVRGADDKWCCWRCAGAV